MEGKICQQCHQVTNVTFNRMVRDSCGHEKCRMCLLQDDTKCLACLKHSSVDNNNSPKVNNDRRLVENLRYNASIAEEIVLNVANNTEISESFDGSHFQQNSKSNEIVLNVAYNKEISESFDGSDFQQNSKSIEEISREKQMNISGVILFNKCISNSTVIAEKDKELDKSNQFTSTNSNINNVHDSKGNPIKRSPRKSLPSHIVLEKVANSNKQSYTCTVCNKKFRSRSQVSFHAHCNSANPFTCTICQERFANCSHFTVHMNIHYRKKIFVCDNCGDSFHQKSKLIRHLLVHSDLRPYKCSACNATFATTVALKRHGASHSSIKPHECKTCGKKFRDVSNLQKHKLKHSGIRYTCKECGKHYTIKFSLMLHMKSHSKDRPEICGYCPKTFYSKKDKNRHELTHLEVKQFQCLLCNIRCRRKDNLVRHFRNTHPDIDRNMISKNSLETKIPEKTKTTEVDDVKQKKRNRKPKKDEILNKIKKDRNEMSEISPNLPQITAILNEPKTIVGDSVNDGENLKTITLTRSEIIEANNKRQSVIFNCQSFNMPDKKCPNVIDVISDTTATAAVLEENQMKKNSPEVVNKPVQQAFTILPPSTYSNSTKYKINDISSIHRRNENTMQQSDPDSIQKKTVNINEAYKQLFSTIKHNESLSNDVKNFDVKKNDSKLNLPTENFQNTQRNSPRGQHYYDQKKYFNPTNMLHNTSNYYDCYSKYARSSSRSFLQDDNEQSSELSPESIELYKKILIPSYKGSNETANNAESSVSSDRENTSNNASPSLKASAESCREEFPPPLVPISYNNTNFCTEPSLFRPESQPKDNFVGNLTAINDVHWRRRLALNSNSQD